MKLLLAITLISSVIWLGYNPQSPEARSEDAPDEATQPKGPTPLDAAVEDLRVMKIKIEGEGGINQKEYGENLADLALITKKAYGNPKALAAIKSAVEGHQLALQFWQCDHTTGYDEAHECQDKVLKNIFAKYPDIEAQAKAAVDGEQLSFISAGLDKDAVLQSVWKKTATDTQIALQANNITPPETTAPERNEQTPPRRVTKGILGLIFSTEQEEKSS